MERYKGMVEELGQMMGKCVGILEMVGKVAKIIKEEG